MSVSASSVSAAKIRVILADDHSLVAGGLELILKESFDLVASVRDGRSLVAAAAQHIPDIIVTDISMPMLNGLDAIRQVQSVHPHIKAIVLTMHSDPELAVSALQAGASGFLLKTSAVEELGTAIHEVMMGRTFITSQVTADIPGLLLKAHNRPVEQSAALTARQREVLQLIAEGRTMKEVANILHISQRTAESHKYDMMQVLQVNTTADLVRYAVRHKLIPE